MHRVSLEVNDNGTLTYSDTITPANRVSLEVNDDGTLTYYSDTNTPV